LGDCFIIPLISAEVGAAEAGVNISSISKPGRTRITSKFIGLYPRRLRTIRYCFSVWSILATNEKLSYADGFDCTDKLL
jgi:hypothetical protein